jgi:hypothetical protein
MKRMSGGRAAQRGETVLEVGRLARSERRLHGKNDQLDASRAARGALAAEMVTLPRAGERQEALRVLPARRSAVDARRHALVQVRSVIATAAEQLRTELRQLSFDAAHSPLQPLPPLVVSEPRTSSPSCSCCAHSRDGSRPPRRRPTNWRARSSSVRSSPSSCTKLVSDRSCPRS